MSDDGCKSIRPPKIGRAIFRAVQLLKSKESTEYVSATRLCR